MCVVSNIGNTWGKEFPDRHPWVSPTFPNTNPIPHKYDPVPTRTEFEKLKNEVEELKELLKAAKKFDEATGQPDCEVDEKVALIKKIADMVGVDMEDVFG